MPPKPSVHEFLRTVPLEHIIRRTTGDGRTVEAYAAVYNRTIEVDGFYFCDPDPFEDEYGLHEESLASKAFAKTLSDNGLKFQVLFNHGKTVQGFPSERYSMPIGVPEEIVSDARGLLTVTRYARTPLADELLELIDAGGITSQSFSGQVISAKLTPRKTAEGLDHVELQEIAMREYGPCVFPAYEDAAILTVRADFFAQHIDKLSATEREQLLQRLQRTPPAAADEGTGDAGPAGDPDTSTPAADLAPAQGPSLERLLAEQAQRRRAAQHV